MSDASFLTLVQEERHELFNKKVAALPEGQGADLSGAHLRAYDLRKFNLAYANLEDAYMRSSDLRGLDLSTARMAGASMMEARISGVLFPEKLSASELLLSLKHGTRLRIQ